MLTITPWDLAVNIGLQIGYSFSAMAGVPVREKMNYSTLLCFHSWQVTDEGRLKSWARLGFEPGTSRTLSENHAPRTMCQRYLRPEGAIPHCAT